MDKRQKTTGGRGVDSPEGAASQRGVRTETVVILVAAAFLLGLIVGAVMALLKTPITGETQQASAPVQGGTPSVVPMDLAQDVQMLVRQLQSLQNKKQMNICTAASLEPEIHVKQYPMFLNTYIEKQM